MSIRNIPGESGAIHTICEIDGKICEQGMLAASLAEDTNELRIQSQKRLDARADEGVATVRQKHKEAIAKTPGAEKYLVELLEASVHTISQVPELNLCRAVCEGRRRILGCGVKTV